MPYKYMLRELTEQLQAAIDTDQFANATVYVTNELIQAVAEKMNWTPSLSAQVVGKMEIDIDNQVLETAKDELDELIRLTVKAMGMLRDGVSRKFGSDAAHLYMQSAISRMSLKL